MVHAALTDVQRDAIGYLGGGVLAVCLIPQVAKVVLTRSARDISILWSLLYTTGLSLSLAYLILKDAPAAWIPLIFEVVGCLLVLALKLYYEHTPGGRRYSAAKQQQRELEAHVAAGAAAYLPTHHQYHHHHHAASPRGRRGIPGLGHAAAAAVGASGDISWRGSVVLGRSQTAPDAAVPPMLDASVRSTRSSCRDASAHGGGGGGGRCGIASAHGLPLSELGLKGAAALPAAAQGAAPAAGQSQPQQQPHADAAAVVGDGACLEVRCTGTSAGSTHSSSSSSSLSSSDGAGGTSASGCCDQQEHGASAAVPSSSARQQLDGDLRGAQQQAPVVEPLFASGWTMAPVAPTPVASPMPPGAGGRGLTGPPGPHG